MKGEAEGGRTGEAESHEEVAQLRVGELGAWVNNTRSAHKTPFKVGKKEGGTLKSGDAAAGRSEEVVKRNVDTHHT